MGFRLPYHAEAFSLDKTTKRRGRGDTSPTHLAFVRTLPCTCCGSRRNIEAAHVRFASPAHGKPSTAMARKPPDRYTVPLCDCCHRTGPDAQHRGNEREFWDRVGIDPCALAMALKAVSGITEAGEDIIHAMRAKATAKKKPHV